ncbi:hypothetical protein [Microbacterium sp. 77mftsu3.1]|uniref:hypothetical protein n=1 Tax=Microbacterium sp. 77mftsu3.1 TaxID=1761802 RepID=UPI00038071DF|nr:hypothetical protein [Microbacterium sp. 77mftsu3.1]SDH41110.1 hypothetical protein SAMN04488590_3272 [Microbacterium sp. 77mftsu3.1]
MSREVSTPPIAPGTVVTLPADEETTDLVAERAEEILDAETHQDLCACVSYPQNCVTYGTRRPWSHSDPGAWTRAVLAALVEVNQA